MNRDMKVRGTQSSYVQSNGTHLCDIEELAEHFSKNVGNIPERVGFGRACEIHLLAKSFLSLQKKLEMMEEAFDTKTRVHDKLNKDYIIIRDKYNEVKS